MGDHEVQALARALFVQHGLNDWRFAFDRGRTRLGACHFDDRLITMSRHLPRLNDESVVRETLLHEIAHALVGPGHGHDAVWKACARRIGAHPRAQSATVAVPKPKWRLVCTDCGLIVAERHARRMKPSRYRCAECAPAAGRLTWEQNEI